MADAPTAITTLLHAPLPDMLERLGNAVANAQSALDRTSIEIAQKMGDPEAGIEVGGKKISMLDAGFTPTFYAFTEATIEIKVAFSTQESTEIGVGAHLGAQIYFVAASVDAHYTSKYSFDASGSSAIKAKLVSLPPPTRLNDLLRESAAKQQG